MDGPAKSRLRRHLELARENLELYKISMSLAYNSPGHEELLEKAEFHMHTAKEIYDVITDPYSIPCDEPEESGLEWLGI